MSMTKKGRWGVGVQVVAVWLGSWAMAGAWQERIDQREATRDTMLMTQEHYAPLQAEQRVLTVDVRSWISWQEGRIPGAMHVPLTQVEERVDEIRKAAKGRMVVTYCSCPTEGSSLRSAETLMAQGVQARALLGGYPKWVERGGRVER